MPKMLTCAKMCTLFGKYRLSQNGVIRRHRSMSHLQNTILHTKKMPRLPKPTDQRIWSRSTKSRRISRAKLQDFSTHCRVRNRKIPHKNQKTPNGIFYKKIIPRYGLIDNATSWSANRLGCIFASRLRAQYTRLYGIRE